MTRPTAIMPSLIHGFCQLEGDDDIPCLQHPSQASTDSLQEISQVHSLGLSSPSALILPPESAHSPSRGRGGDAAVGWLGRGRVTSAAAAAAAASRADMYLRASKEGLEELLR